MKPLIQESSNAWRMSGLILSCPRVYCPSGPAGTTRIQSGPIPVAEGWGHIAAMGRWPAGARTVRNRPEGKGNRRGRRLPSLRLGSRHIHGAVCGHRPDASTCTGRAIPPGTRASRLRASGRAGRHRRRCLRRADPRPLRRATAAHAGRAPEPRDRPTLPAATRRAPPLPSTVAMRTRRMFERPARARAIARHFGCQEDQIRRCGTRWRVWATTR